MRRDLDAAELAALEWAHELDQRAARQLVRPDIREAMEWGDLDSAGFILGARMRITEAQPLASHPGLVSVPTSFKRSLKQKPCSDAIALAAAEALDAFLIDKPARRLSTLRRSVGFAARAHLTGHAATVGEECLMVTLTYRGTNADWQPKHISGFMAEVREYFRINQLGAVRYVWVAELQQRGVIHYHVALWVPAGVRLPMPDNVGWWPHGMTRIEVARAAVPYLLKYLSKDTSKTFGEFPHGARIYGVGGLDHAARRARRWLGLPSFVQGNASMYDEWKRAPRELCRRGGWLSPSGEHFPSEFARVCVAGRDGLKRVCTHSRSIQADGPFAWLTDKPKVREVWTRLAS